MTIQQHLEDMAILYRWDNAEVIGIGTYKGLEALSERVVSCRGIIKGLLAADLDDVAYALDCFRHSHFKQAGHEHIKVVTWEDFPQCAALCGDEIFIGEIRGV